MEASQVAKTLISQSTVKAESDPDFWNFDHPEPDTYETGAIKVANTEYRYRVHTQTLFDPATGLEFGSKVPANRVKKLDVVVEWFDKKDGPGYGVRKVTETCLINE